MDPTRVGLMVSDPLGSVRVRVPAKINLDLSVGALRADGFHPVHTVFQAVSLFDELLVRPAERSSLVVTGLQAGVPLDGSNLVLQAAQALAARLGRPDSGVQIELHKRIPVAGGMAGGSADAAAALVACAALWQSDITREQLLDVAAELGSDVPFALLGGTAVGAGRGELVTSVLARGRFHWVLVPAGQGLSAAAVYTEFDRLTQDRILVEPAVSDRLMQALRSGNATVLGSALRNDLQAAACSLRPELGELLALGKSCGALAGVVSGSGPTVAFLVRDHEHGLDLSVALAASGVAEILRVHGPVSGAKIYQE